MSSKLALGWEHCRLAKIQISRIREALSILQAATPDVFGASAHQFRLNPPVSESEVEDFELRFRIDLPAEYREFLTVAGNGGAGPFHGIFPLGNVDDNFDLREFHEGDGLVGNLAEYFPHKEAWNDLTGQPEEGLANVDELEYSKQEEMFTKTYWSSSLVAGAIPICHEGCALRIELVVTGSERGYLWEDRRSEFGGLEPIRLADGSKATFANWYSEWLVACTSQIR